MAQLPGWPVVPRKYPGTCIRVSGRFQPIRAITGLHVSGYPGKKLEAVYPGRTSQSGKTNPGKTSHPGIRAKPGHLGNPLEPAGPSWSQLVPTGCQLVPTQLANHRIRANLGIRVSGRILVSRQTNWRKLPDRFGRPPPILSGYPGISQQPGRCNLSIPRYYRPPSLHVTIAF